MFATLMAAGCRLARSLRSPRSLSRGYSRAGQSIKVDPAAANTGSVALTAYDVPDDVTGTLTPGGSNVTPSLSTPGQNALYTLGTPTNSRVSLKMGGGPTGSAVVRNPDGSTLTSGSIGIFANFIEPWTFASGQTVKVDPGGSNTGNVTLTAYDVPADVTGSVTIGGSAAGVTITAPGQKGSLTFTGTASQQLTVHVTGNTMSTVTVKLLSTNGVTVLASSASSASSFNLSTVTLPSSGTYTITVDPSSFNVGSLNVGLTSP